MSFSAVVSSFSRIRKHIEERELLVPYAFVNETFNRIKKLFIDWLDIYGAYNKGYSQMVLSYVNLQLVKTLSTYGIIFEKKFEDIFNARIAPEVYILVNDLLHNLDHPSAFFVLAEGDSFQETTIYEEVLRATNGLSVSGSDDAGSTIPVLKTNIRQNDIGVLYYESGQYDNPLAWPLLLHEALHFIYDSEGLRRLEEYCPTVSWIQETIIDLYAMLFFGPAFAASAAVHLERFPHPQTISHPPFISRVYLSLLYLTHLVDNREGLPLPLCAQVNETFQYVKAVWDKYKTKFPGVEKDVGKIYDASEEHMRRNMSRKALPFQDFLHSQIENRTKIGKLDPEDYVEQEVISMEDVQEYYQHGIPVAADPRILFNSFVAKRFLEEGIIKTFVTQSLKKWYLANKWKQLSQNVGTH